MKPIVGVAGVILAMLLASSQAAAGESSDLRVRGRLQTRFEVEEKEQGGWTSAFQLERARVDGRWAPTDRLRLVLEFEGAYRVELNQGAAPSVELKDAYGRFDLHRALVVSAGQFKKPFSRLKMTSPWDLPLPERGLLDKYAVANTSHGGYGGRDIGVMLSGRLLKTARFRYYLGAFNGSGFIDGEEESHKDFVGRIQVRPFGGLRLALGACHKLYHDRQGLTHTVNLFGADARYRRGNFTLWLEGAYGDNPDAGAGRQLFGFHGIAIYAFSIGEDLNLTPALMVELFDPDDRIAGGRALRVAGALNLDVGKGCRVVLFAERSSGELRAFDVVENQIRVEPGLARVLLQLNLSF